MKAVLGTHSLWIQGLGQPQRSHLTAFVPYPYCGKHIFCSFASFFSWTKSCKGWLAPCIPHSHITAVSHHSTWTLVMYNKYSSERAQDSHKLPVMARKIRADVNQHRNSFLHMCRQSISTDTAESQGTGYSPVMTCSAAKASSSQKSTFKQELSHSLS